MFTIFLRVFNKITTTHSVLQGARRCVLLTFANVNGYFRLSSVTRYFCGCVCADFWFDTDDDVENNDARERAFRFVPTTLHYQVR